MKNWVQNAFAGLVLAVLVGLSMLLGWRMGVKSNSTWHSDSQVAEGEWKIEMQTPPCDNVHNLQVIWPKESGYPMTIECDKMPVNQR